MSANVETMFSVRKNDFKALIYDELEYFVRYDGENFPVNPDDCVEK